MNQIDIQRIRGLEAALRISAVADPKTDPIRAVRRDFSRRLAWIPADLVIGLALRLVRHRQVILRFVAYELVQHHKPAAASLNTRLLEELGQDLDSWVAVDTFAYYLAGPAWREQQVSDATIRRWASSKDRWWRRAALG